MNYLIPATSLALTLCVSFDALHATTVGYWRMEQDENPNTLAYSIPNEVAGGNPLVGAFGEIESDVPNNPITLTGATNLGALAGLDDTNFSPDISGGIAHYAALDTGSITIEFFARTTEGTGNFIQRRVTADTGLLINSPNRLNVFYTTASGRVELRDLFDFGTDWEHFAFTYDQATGVGKVYVSGTLVGMNDGPDGEALTWPDNEALLVGGALSGGSLDREAIFDELRISSVALDTTQFLDPFVVPEPTSLALLGLGGLMTFRRKRASVSRS